VKADRCRGCGSENLVTLHDFGDQPLAGHYPTMPNSALPAKKYPLDLTQCGACGLLQVTNLPPIEEVFHDDYRYSSSTVPGLVCHFHEYAEWLSQRLSSKAKVLEFGCNDGVLLERLQKRGFDCAGIDASDNVATLAREKGLNVTTGFLNTALVLEKGYENQFDIVTCSNVFAHIHDLSGTLQAVRALLKTNGLFAIEVHDGELLSNEGQFDTVYHEHLTYFTEASLRGLLERSGFEFVECARTTMHGGGLRFVARYLKEPSGQGETDGAVSLLSDFVSPSIERCRAELERLYKTYGPLAGYGAAGRSQMFINFTGSDHLFSQVFDDSPFRQGRYITATDIPIVPYENNTGQCAVILAWNYAADITAKIRGNFKEVVTLLPETRIW